MSRSYKHTPGWTLAPRCSKQVKRWANRVVRRRWGLSNGGSYKKLFESWNICDYKDLYYNREQVEHFLATFPTQRRHKLISK